MERNYNWNPNEQGRDTLANNANDWRSQHEPDLRKRVFFAIVEKLKIRFPNRIQNDINKTASEFEDKIYGKATDKDDYLRKISEKIMVFERKFKSLQSGSSANGPNTTQDQAQGLNLGQSSLQYTQNPTSQQLFHQKHNQESYGFSNQVPITAAQSLNIKTGEEVHSDLYSSSQRHTQGRQQFCSQPQQQPKSYHDMFLKDKIHQMHQYTQQHQQHHDQQSLLKQPIHQQLPHHTSFSTIHQSFPQTSAHSSLRHQFPTQRVSSSHQQQMAMPSHELLVSQMNGQDMQQNHLTSQQNNWEQQGAYTGSSSQQNNIASFQETSQQNYNHQDMYQQQQNLYSYSNNASAFPSQQQQYMSGGQSDNFNVHGTSLLGAQSQEVVQYQQPQNRILQQHLDDTQRFQATGSFHQTQNIGNQQKQPYTFQDSTDKTAYANGGDWQEETYQKIKALKEKYLPVLSTLLQRVTKKLLEIDSHPHQKMQQEPIQKLRAGKSTLEQVNDFLNVGRDGISESHRDKFSQYEEQILRFTKNHQTVTQTSGHNQVHVSQSLDNDPAQSSVFHQKHFHHLQMQHQLMQRQQPQIQNHSSPQFVDQKILTTTFHNTGSSSQSVGSPFVAPYPNLGDLENPISVDSPFSHDYYQLQTRAQEQPIDRLIKAENEFGRYKQFSSLEYEADATASTNSKVHKIEPGYALMQEIKEINETFVETVVNICNEEFYQSEVTSGTIVTCSYYPMSLSGILEAHYKSGHISQIQPLRLLVPLNYPYSPILLLERVSSDASLHSYDDLSARTRSRFSLSMKEFSEPISLKEIAQVWDVCARETMAEYAERHGGGTFSSKYGHWKPSLGA